MIGFLKVAAIATAMAAVGTLFVFGSGVRNWFPAECHEWLAGFLPKVIVVSNMLWLVVALEFRRRPVSLKRAIEVGAASPFLGAKLLGILFPSGLFRPGSYHAASQSVTAKIAGGVLGYLMGVASAFWLFMPIGIATGYLVYRAQMRETSLAYMALQQTRRPRFRSGRSLRSLGSPLNAQPSGGGTPSGL